jgi:hypothetical protein
LIGYVTNEFDSLLIADPILSEEAADAWGVDGRYVGQVLGTREGGELIRGAVVAPTDLPDWVFGVFVVRDGVGKVVRLEIEPVDADTV